jgi:O-antigen/teichoic acid export membrane protein
VGWINKNVLSATGTLLSACLVQLMLNLDVLGLKLLSVGGQGDVISGYYQAAVILARTPVFLAQALTLVLFSYAAGSVLQEFGKESRLSSYFLAAIRSWFRFLVPIGLVLIFAPEDILTLMFPAQYQASSDILRIAAIGGLLLSLVTMLNGVLQATGSKQAALSAASATVSNCGTHGWFRFLVLNTMSLVVAGSIALTGMMVTYFRLNPFDLKRLKGTEIWGIVLREALPITVMSITLLLVPGGNRFLILIKLALVAVLYLVVLFAVQTRGKEHRSERSNPFMSLIQIVIG